MHTTISAYACTQTHKHACRQRITYMHANIQSQLEDPKHPKVDAKRTPQYWYNYLTGILDRIKNGVDPGTVLRPDADVCWRMLAYADVWWRWPRCCFSASFVIPYYTCNVNAHPEAQIMLTYPDVCRNVNKYASWRTKSVARLQLATDWVHWCSTLNRSGHLLRGWV